ncbi:ABC transporter permease [Paenibacillus sp. FSL R10-2782]|uniref:YhgE/Pip domain-containing protein n=1 Tax=Paenibacillus sp. FSL R10-2782 TaxID=2954661 RepID=UPI0031597D69
MKHAIISLMKHPAAKSALITALMFQVIFSLVWMTGYKNVSNNVHNLKIALVTESNAQKELATRLKSALPFSTVILDSRETAMKQLENRDIQMAAVFNADFTGQPLSSNKPATIEYFINESNPQMIKAIMEKTVATITDHTNLEATATPPAVVSDLHYLHPVNGTHNQMLPMMMLLASFVGAMIMQLNMQQAAMTLSTRIGKWRLFGARTLINVAAAIVISAVGSTLVLALGGQNAGGFIALWLFQSLFLAAFMFYSQMFLIVFGMPGMLLNIISLSVQLVTSGATIPRELLSGFYHNISAFLPATYAVNGLMNLLFGGPSIGHATSILILFIVIYLGISTFAVMLRGKNKASQIQPTPAHH